MYSHIHLAQVAVAVLDDVCVFGAVEGGNRSSVCFGPHAVVGGVDGDRHHMDAQVTHEHDARTLTHTLRITHTHLQHHTVIQVCYKPAAAR